MPKVSIHIPCYNSEKYIADTIESVLGQTFKDFEVIIINDGSADGTEKIIKGFSDPRIRYVYQANQGLAATRNNALALSRGEYIAFIDHDDVWGKDKLEKEVRALDESKEAVLVYSNFYKIFPNGKRRVEYKGERPSGNIFAQFLYDYTICISTVLIRKDVFNMKSLFDDNLKIFEDYDLFLRILHDHKGLYIHEALAGYRMHDQRSSLKFSSRYADEYIYVIEKFKKIFPSFEAVYKCPLEHVMRNIDYLKAKLAMGGANAADARKYLGKHKWRAPKFLLSYILTYMPLSVWNRIYSTENTRSIV